MPILNCLKHKDHYNFFLKFYENIILIYCNFYFLNKIVIIMFRINKIFNKKIDSQRIILNFFKVFKRSKTISKILHES